MPLLDNDSEQAAAAYIVSRAHRRTRPLPRLAQTAFSKPLNRDRRSMINRQYDRFPIRSESVSGIPL